MTTTNRTTADLREAIAAKIAPHMRMTTFNADCEDQERNKQYALEVADSILALLPQPPALGGQVCQDAKNKIVAAILRYPPETMTEAERIADDLVQAIVPTQEEWRPIETAPKDERVILFSPFWGTEVGYHSITYTQEPSWFSSGGAPYADHQQPTHWRQIPTPPQSKKEG